MLQHNKSTFNDLLYKYALQDTINMHYKTLGSLVALALTNRSIFLIEE